MIVQCEGCSTRFRLPDEKVTPKGVHVRCTRCKKTFVVHGPAAGSEHAEGGVSVEAPDTSQPESPAASHLDAEAASKEQLSAADLPPGEDAGKLGDDGTQNQAEVKFNLDELLGKDFNLDLPPPTSDVAEGSFSSSPASGDASSGSLGPAAEAHDSDGLGEQKADSSDPFEGLLPGASSGDAAGAPADLPDPISAVSSGKDDPFDSPPAPGDTASEEPAPDAGAFSAGDGDGVASVDAREEAAEPAASNTTSNMEDVFSEPAEMEDDLSKTLFEGLDLDAAAGKEKESSSLESMFEEGDIFRDDAPIPSEDDVDSALSALDVSESPLEVSEDIDLEADVDADVDVSSWDDFEKVGSPQVDAAALPDTPAEGELTDDSRGSAKEDDFASAAWGEPAAAGDAKSKESEGWSLGLEKPPAPSSEDGEAGMPSLGASGSAGSEASSFNASAAPAFEMDGPPGLDLENLPPLDLADSNAFDEKNEPSPDFDFSMPGAATGDDPFSALSEQEPASLDDASDLFDRALEGSSPEPAPSLAGNGEASANALGTPLGRIAVGPPKKKRPGVGRQQEGLSEETMGPPPSAGVTGFLAMVANIVFAGALLVVAMGAFVVFRTGGPIDASVLTPDRVMEALSPAAAGGPRVRVHTTGLYPTREGGRLLYMRGELRNGSREDVDVRSLRLVGRAINADGVEVQSAEAIIGRLPSPEELWSVGSFADIERIRRRIEEKSEKEAEAGERLEFFVIFGEAPEDLYSLRFEVSLVDEHKTNPAGN